MVVVAQAGAWPGQSDVKKKVTPLRVRITNGSNQQIRVRYEDLALVAVDGTRYSAIPPRAARTMGPSAANAAHELRQDFGYAGFLVAQAPGFRAARCAGL